MHRREFYKFLASFSYLNFKKEDLPRVSYGEERGAVTGFDGGKFGVSDKNTRVWGGIWIGAEDLEQELVGWE